MRVVILDSAQDDLIRGFRFYEDQEAGLGSYFLDSLFSDIDALRFHGGIHPIHFRHFHRALSKRFPFAIYYKIEKALVRIFAVLDCRRNPAWIRKKLG